MKKIKLALLGVMLLAPVTGFADEGHAHDHGSTKSGKQDDAKDAKSKAELLAELSGVMSQIQTAVSAKDAAKLHDLTESLPRLASRIAEKAPEAAAVRAQGSAKNIAALSAKLHTEADKSEFEAAAKTAHKLDGMVKLFVGQVA